ncbi:MAG: hypothetical protein ACLGI6_17040 [Gammaproteobacteria bacterium]
MRPDQCLPDGQNQVEVNGVTVRKGSVGAFLASVRVWRDAQAAEAERQAAQEDIVALIPSLQSLGLFEVLAPVDPQLRALVEAHASRPAGAAPGQGAT